MLLAFTTSPVSQRNLIVDDIEILIKYIFLFIFSESQSTVGLEYDNSHQSNLHFQTVFDIEGENVHRIHI